MTRPGDRRGVSEVVGVILVVAITVVLAGIVSGFALGLFDDTPSPPTATFAISYSPDSTLEIRHESGQNVLPSELHLRGDCDGCDQGVGLHWANYSGAGVSGSIDGTPAVAAGDTVVLTDVGPDFDIDVVWETSEGDASTILGSRRGSES